MPTPEVGGEEGTSLLKRIGRAAQLFTQGLRGGIRDFRRPRARARSRRGDFRRGRRDVQRGTG